MHACPRQVGRSRPATRLRVTAAHVHSWRSSKLDEFVVHIQLQVVVVQVCSSSIEGTRLIRLGSRKRPELVSGLPPERVPAVHAGHAKHNAAAAAAADAAACWPCCRLSAGSTKMMHAMHNASPEAQHRQRRSRRTGAVSLHCVAVLVKQKLRQAKGAVQGAGIEKLEQHRPHFCSNQRHAWHAVPRSTPRNPCPPFQSSTAHPLRAQTRFHLRACAA